MSAANEASVTTTVGAGDLVHYWPENPPPLSDTYKAPPCLPALVIRLYPDGHYLWLADLAIVDPAAMELRVVQVPMMLSYAQNGYRGERSYGVPASWHTPLTHPGAQP